MVSKHAFLYPSLPDYLIKIATIRVLLCFTLRFCLSSMGSWPRLRHFTTFVSYRERLVSLGLLPLSYWHEYLDLVFFFKAVNGLVDVSHDVLPELISETRTTRSSSGNQISFRPAKCKTSTYQRSFFIRATRTWNSLPPTLRSPGLNIRQFKTDLQNYYLIALRECFNENDPRTWKTICLKCNASRNLRSKLTCCFW